MPGCSNGNPLDTYLERALHLHSEGGDNPAKDQAVEEYGAFLGEHPTYGLVFERGVGYPYLYNKGKDSHLAGVQDAKVRMDKAGRLLVKVGCLAVRNKNTDHHLGRVFRTLFVFVLEEPPWPIK